MESLSDAGGRGVGVRAFVGPALGLRVLHRSLRRGPARCRPRRPRGGGGGRPGRVRPASPSAAGRRRVEGLASPGARPAGPPSRRWSWRWRRSGPPAPARASPRSSTRSTRTRRGRWRSSNSHGFAGGFDATQAWAYASAFAGEGSDLMTGLGVALGRDPRRSTPRPSAPRRPSARWRWSGARQPESRRCPVVLDAFVAASFVASSARCSPPTPFSAAAPCSPGGRARRWRDPRFELVDDATDPDGPASAPFDGEGSATRRTPLIEGGRLLDLPLRRAHRAARPGARPRPTRRRGSYRSPPSVGTSNLIVEPGERDLAELRAPRPATGCT